MTTRMHPWIYDQTTPEVARAAANAINAFMATWNDRLDPEFLKTYGPSRFHGAKVTRLERLLATPEYEPKNTLWHACFDRGDCPRLCFEVRDGKATFASKRTFDEEDWQEPETPPAPAPTAEPEPEHKPHKRRTTKKTQPVLAEVESLAQPAFAAQAKPVSGF